MKNISIWQDLKKDKNYNKLEKDIDLDVLIIGGGITGVSTLYQLKNSHLNVALVEQNEIGLSTTAKSTGKLNFLQNDLLDKINNNLGEKISADYLKSQIETIDMMLKIIKDEKINCDLQKVKTYLYTNKYNEINKIKKLEKFLHKNNIMTKETTLGIVKNKYLIETIDTYTIHPLKYLYGLLKNNKYPVYENTSIKKIIKDKDYYICYTEKNKIRTKWVVLASHYPYFNIPFLFPIKSSLEKSYLSASKCQTRPISLISYSNPFISIRNYQDYLIYLSNSHSINNDLDEEENYRELIKKISDLNLKPEYLWSNIDIMTNDGLPYIGALQEKMLIGTGYNTWGLTNGSLAGKLISDIILGNKNSYQDLFDPKRVNIAGLTKVASNVYNSIDGYIKGYFFKSKKVKYHNDVMIYKDYKVKHTCPHLGCKLHFNEVELTWDCPCHGSRFSIEGKPISAPANKNIKVDKKE